MRSLLLAIGLFAGIVCGTTSIPLPTETIPACSKPSDVLFEQIIAPYVAICSRDGEEIGAGTVIETKRGLRILTAAHCVDGAKLVRIQKQSEVETSGHWWECEVESFSFEDDGMAVDLAILRPLNDITGLIPARYLGHTRIGRGDECWYVGTAAGIHGTLERSIINRPSHRILSHYWYLFNGNVWYGNSGGGLYVKDGDDYVLIGVVCRVYTYPKGPGLAMTQQTINAFLTAGGYR